VKREPHHPGRDGAARDASQCSFRATPVASPGRISIVFIMIFQGFGALHVVAETFYAGLNDFHAGLDPDVRDDGARDRLLARGKTLRSARSLALPAAGRPGDLQPGSVRRCSRADRVIARVAARRSARWASPRCAGRAIRTSRDRVDSARAARSASWIPPSITFILYGIATETSIGRLFLAGVMPASCSPVLFMLWDAVHHLEARIPLACGRVPLQLEGKGSSRSRRSRPFLAIIAVSCTCSTAGSRRLGSGGRGRGAVPGARRDDLQDVAAAGSGG